MGSEHLNADIFRLLRTGREGVQFERSFRALAFLLGRWYDYADRRKQDEGDGTRQLKSIAFDKLVTLVMRLWDRLYELSPRLQVDSQSSGVTIVMDEEGVTFPCPLRELPGKHGPGRAVYNGQSAPDFIVSVLYKLQQDDILHYFSVKPATDGPDRGKSGRVLVTGPETVVLPGVPITNKKEFLARFTPREVELISDLERGLRKMDSSEIRALGTHESLERTIAAIRWEYRALKRLGVQQAIRVAVDKNCQFTDAAQLWVEYSSEARAKASENQSAYASGWAIMNAELSDPELREVFTHTQARAAEIWGGEEMKSHSRVAVESRAYSRYFLSISLGLEGADGRFRYALGKAAKECMDVGIRGLPLAAEDIFVVDRCLRPDLKVILCDRLDQIFNRMSSC